ncbi:hypothetical protein [Ramlibacter algicola]|uniref:DUF2029 domain-containing protein n=1 Tax=Ramlibacter algicola TaxID=2795217 RepID=A0A934PYT0_9BURK|nr:hypothetical protein [Ramlibacter algicola]MBK0391281.1 hypothetical protein [Ramlibacter algicola]
MLLCAIAWASLLAIPLSMGELGLGWDALNHHIYLGWTAEHPRFDQDFVGAGYQSFQAPYLYWPLYRMAVGGWAGVPAAAVLATLHVAVLWPLWMLVRTCVPGASVHDAAMRACAMALGLLSVVVLSAFGSTMNDVLAAAPLLAALALGLQPAAQPGAMTQRTACRYVLASGACAGIAVALKLSQGPLAVLLPALWWFAAHKLLARAQAVLVGGAAAVAAFALAYGPWGWQLWRHFGNPIFPFHHHWFAPLRAALGWAG